MSNPFESREQNSMRGPAGRVKRTRLEHRSMYTQNQLEYNGKEERVEEEYDGEDYEGEDEEWKEGDDEQPHPPPSKRRRHDPHTTTTTNADQSPSFAKSGQSKALAASSSSIHRSVTIKGQVYHFNLAEEWLCTRAPCPKTFATKGGLERHVKDKHDGIGGRYSCIICHRTFQEKHLVKRHQKTLSKNFSGCNNAWYAGLVPGSPGYAGPLDIPMVLPNPHPTPFGPTFTVPRVVTSAGLPSDQNTPPIYGGSLLSNQDSQTRELSSTLAQASGSGPSYGTQRTLNGQRTGHTGPRKPNKQHHAAANSSNTRGFPVPSDYSPVLYGPESSRRSDMAPRPSHGLVPRRLEAQRYDDEFEDPEPLGLYAVASEAQSFAPQHLQGFKQRTLAVGQPPAIHTVESHPAASQQLSGSMLRTVEQVSDSQTAENSTHSFAFQYPPNLEQRSGTVFQTPDVRTSERQENQNEPEPTEAQLHSQFDVYHATSSPDMEFNYARLPHFSNPLF